MPSLNPEHVKAIISAINACPFFQHMSMEVIEIRSGYSMVTAEIRREHMNPFGGLHGGAYSSVIDTAAYWSAYCDLPEDSGLVSIDLKVDFLAPVSEGRIMVEGHTIKSGKTLYLTEARMFDGNDRLLAHGTSKLMAGPNRQPLHDAVNFLGSGNLPKKFLEE